MVNPYSNLPENNFWRSAVAEKHILDIEGLWSPKFRIRPEDKVVTYGSCFAQHMGNALREREFNWFISEKAPQTVRENVSKAYNYNIFSSRTGNIYTTTLLSQWVKWSLGEKVPDEVWEKEGRFYDPFRPRIEPDGFRSVEEMRRSREQAIVSFRESYEKAKFFVFTMGLTESWFNSVDDYEYPMCPGTAAGEFDASKHKFVNQRFSQIRRGLNDAIDGMRSVNPGLKFILTVSPVPLVATKEDRHVLVSTMHSKSMLRAVAGELEATRAVVDYFPSYEIINSPAFQGFFFEKNKRSVSPHGVRFVMNSFFSCLERKFGVRSKRSSNLSSDVVCEEEILAAFGGN